MSLALLECAVVPMKPPMVLTGMRRPRLPPPRPLIFPKTSEATVPAGSKLKDMIKEMNIRQRVEGATGGTNVAMNPVINVHGVPAGSEAAIGTAVQKAIQDPKPPLSGTNHLLLGALATQKEDSFTLLGQLSPVIYPALCGFRPRLNPCA